ncbi:putative gustatory receptor 89a [Scaptodrosophila lebanonensis]|uniref:Gustatory receptor n=1 Tax=Drosophila lebanonensis TaxID=7225 RepID=A0A6J2T0H4_DROLE|nr:putative gustatory receptor 89a [Scaptodrosophila lebanonensis]
MLPWLHAPVQRFGTLSLCLLLWLWQLVDLAPLTYCRRHGVYRSHRLITSGALFKLVGLWIVAPLLFRLTMALYGTTNVAHSDLFTTIAELTMASDMIISLVLLGAHIWRRRHLAKLLNGVVRLELHRQGLRRPQLLLLLWAKLLLSSYELLCNVPFLRRHARLLAWWRLLAYAAQQYVQHLSTVYTNGIFALLLLMLTGLGRLEQDWQQYEGDRSERRRLLRRERQLLKLCETFVQCFQLGIFLVLIGHFLNILANMYAMLDYFVSQHGVPLTMSNYCLFVTIELYALVLVAYMCQARHARLRDRCLEQCYVPERMSKQQAMQRTPLFLLPTSTFQFSILGLFVLDNEFWLFLVSYAADFIVIILQFTLTNIKR